MVTIDTPKVTQPKDTVGFSSNEMNVLQEREALQLCAAKELVHGRWQSSQLPRRAGRALQQMADRFAPSTVSSDLQVDFTRILLIFSTSDSSRRGFAALYFRPIEEEDPAGVLPL
jgi:hypothetical protein